MTGNDEVFQRVSECLVEALGVEEDEISPEASLTKDLGAESIDFLDIVFRLEKTFGIKIPRGELFPENLVSEPGYVQDGKLTPAGLQQLKGKMPYADLAEFGKDPKVSNIPDLFNVGMIVRYVRDKPSNLKAVAE